MEADFVRRFTEAWSAPTSEGLVALLHREVVLLQPHLPPIHGRDAALDDFERLLRWLPGLRGEVERWSGSNGLLFIEWELKFPLGRGVSIPMVDRFRLVSGLCLEREVYFDQLPLVTAVLTNPQEWFGFLGYRFRRR